MPGPTPRGLAGTHIHVLDPVSRGKTVWYIGYSDVVAIGELFATGQPPIDKVVSIAGPPVTDPRLLRTRIGASTDELVVGEVAEGDIRVISGPGH